MTKYFVHKAVEFDAMTAKARKLLGVEDVDMLHATHWAQRKYDGCNGIVIVNPSEVQMISRTGEAVLSCDHIRRAARSGAFSHLLEKGQGFVLLGGVWQAGVDQPAISGDFRRHNQAPQLQFIAFDILPLTDFEAGSCDTPFQKRYERLSTLLRGSHPTDVIRLCETYTPGSYGGVWFMCDDLLKQGGYDGLILRQGAGLWRAGSGTTGEIIKVKRRLSYDMRVIDLEEGKGRNAGRVGALVVQGPKGPVKVNSGTDKQRTDWWDNPSLIVNHIVEVFCLGFTTSGSLREPTLGEVRFDKEEADF